VKFCFYSSLKESAKRAFKQGDGKHGKYVVDGNHIAVVGKDGRAKDWLLVVRGQGKAIKAKEA
jgi:hypothetical protein